MLNPVGMKQEHKCEGLSDYNRIFLVSFGGEESWEVWEVGHVVTYINFCPFCGTKLVIQDKPIDLTFFG